MANSSRKLIHLDGINLDNLNRLCTTFLSGLKIILFFIYFKVLRPAVINFTLWIQSLDSDGEDQGERLRRISRTDIFFNMLRELYPDDKPEDRNPYMSESDRVFLDMISKKHGTDFKFNEAECAKDHQTRQWEHFRQQMSADDAFVRDYFQKIGFKFHDHKFR